jgi:hypothetical protein
MLRVIATLASVLALVVLLMLDGRPVAQDAGLRLAAVTEPR